MVRVVALVALCGLARAAAAEEPAVLPRPPTVDMAHMCATRVNREFVPPEQASARLAEDPGVARTVYLHRCGPEGCVLQPGANSSSLDSSTLVEATSTLSAFSQSDEIWARAVTCVRLRLLPFALDIVDAPPGDAPHYEVMIGGQPGELVGPPLPPDTGGVAPAVCAPTTGIAVVFDTWGSSVEGLCYATVHELGHLLGLDHELLAADPMSYIGALGAASVYQNERAECGEREGEDRDCDCERQSQNSFREVLDVVGVAPRLPSRVRVDAPADLAYYVGPFTLTAHAEAGYTRALLYVDGLSRGEIDLAAPQPLELRPGKHVVEVRALYNNNTELDRDRVLVNIGPMCGEPGDCGFGLTCLQDECVAGPSVPGGLGALCLTGDECMTGLCSSEQTCTALCAEDVDCPDEFYCLDDGAGLGECLVGERPATGAGCATSGSGAGAGLAFVALAIGLGTLRRRRSR